MPTFGTIQTSVSRRLLDTNNVAVSLSDVKQAINDAISYWKFRRFWFNETDGTIGTLTAQSDNITLPSGFLVPATDFSGFYIDYSSTRYPLTKISQQQFNSIYLTNGFGLPISYARVNGGYKCYPIPDQNYSYGGNFLKDYVALVADSDTNDFTDNADRLIYLWALANLAGELRQDEKMETYYRGAANNEYNNHQIMTAKTNATGTLTNHSLL